MPKKVRYIDGDPQKGIAYDWNKILKKLKSLNIPDEYFDPSVRPVDDFSWLVFLSERAAGKTTGFLLLGLIMYWIYGTVTIYCRPLSTQIAPKRTSELFGVVVANDYISQITDGRYNNITYLKKYWYLCRTEDGIEVDRDPEPCCYMVAADEHAEIKSGLNLPKGDLILLDEFVAATLLGNGDESELFPRFCDLVSTIFRLRESGKIVLLGNTINKYCQVFADLEIADTLRGMELGDNTDVTTSSGTKVYVELVKPDATFRAKKKSWVKKYMGFLRPELSAITGQATWAMDQYQHIPPGNFKTILTKIYVSDNGKLARLELVNHETLGPCMFVHWATAVYNDSIILTVGDIIDPRYHYGRGPDNFARLWARYRAANRIYYASNDIGSFIANYEQKIIL